MLSPTKLISTLLIIPFLACTALQANTASRADMLGTWACEVKIVEEGGFFKVESEDYYSDDGTSKGTGIMTMKMGPDFPQVTYNYSAEGTWKIRDMQLIETLTRFEVTFVSHPEIEKMVNLESSMPLNQEDAAEIIELTSSMLTLKTDVDGSNHTCYKQ
ncbi:hypothetical protein MIB92_19070 [Aestuariirhabdus sp. Z084]|uniref:hypothetical protein n=1 Tax=Aestuariirhabdus haliotis TaxID=2918751 RepID=UPI00201B4535|nr:hypothetical protein [Aestuariirhabdus haliotis]MCL6417768.1 hypothetical protein [Aestuariirhabdus haliotis]MCL6421697.1 hypothetical protein [Aestuariirhabdus haliotis]